MTVAVVIGREIIDVISVAWEISFFSLISFIVLKG